jgi:hypothetical protein
MFRYVMALMSLGMIVVTGLADVDSGPEKGSTVAKFEVLNCTGDEAGKRVDPTKAGKEGLAVYLFVAADKFDRPMNRFFKGLDEKLSDKVPAIAVWLTDDEDKTKEFLPRVQMSVKYQHLTLAVLAGKEGPKGWNINTDAHLTVILARKGKVVGRWGYRSVNDTDLPDVLAVLKKEE